MHKTLLRVRKQARSATTPERKKTVLKGVKFSALNQSKLTFLRLNICALAICSSSYPQYMTERDSDILEHNISP
ncbi:MAG: hypothetical protein RI947_938 [Candidatus Parcubacteria bacterium]|jgi:hypothetical protein